MSRKEYSEKLIKLHQDVDRIAGAIMNKSDIDYKCGVGCTDCCVDELTVFEVEAGRIKAEYPDVLKQQPGPEGACAFLDNEGNCRVYLARPYVCRTQGLPLRWIGQTEDGITAEFRDICPLNDHGTPIETLPEGSCFTLGPFEGELRRLQSELGGDELTRIALRSMFEKQVE